MILETLFYRTASVLLAVLCKCKETLPIFSRAIPGGSSYSIRALCLLMSVESDPKDILFLIYLCLLHVCTSHGIQCTLPNFVLFQRFTGEASAPFAAPHSATQDTVVYLPRYGI